MGYGSGLLELEEATTTTTRRRFENYHRVPAYRQLHPALVRISIYFNNFTVICRRVDIMMAFAENQSTNSTVDGRVKEVMVDSRINKASKHQTGLLC